MGKPTTYQCFFGVYPDKYCKSVHLHGWEDKDLKNACKLVSEYLSKMEVDAAVYEAASVMTGAPLTTKQHQYAIAAKAKYIDADMWGQYLKDPHITITAIAKSYGVTGTVMGNRLRRAQRRFYAWALTHKGVKVQSSYLRDIGYPQ